VHTTYAAEVAVKAWLTGHEFDLECLVDLLRSGDVRVVKEGDQFYLTSPALDAAGDDAASGHDIAQRLLTQICGVARARDPDFKNVKLTGRYQDGELTHVVGLTATLEIRAQIRAAGVVAGDDVPPQPSPAGAKYLTVAGANRDVAEVLEIMSAEPLNWTDLYKIYEIIQDTGMLETVTQTASISNRDITRFTRTANHQEASGADARHARLSQEPPSNPMTIEQARGMIGRLVTAWMDSL
jgi:hypothetical protein